MKIFVALAVFLISILVEAQTLPALSTNGCGAAGWSSMLVPNSTVISACVFKTACDKHDLCYGKCLLGGELYGQATCSSTEDRAERRKACDVSLRSNIVADNGTKKICGTYASLYKWAVVKFAEKAFNGAVGNNLNRKEIARFLEYLQANPDAFDQLMLEQAFNTMAENATTAEDNTMVKFSVAIPRLEIIAYDPVADKFVAVLDVRGKVKIEGAP